MQIKFMIYFKYYRKEMFSKQRYRTDKKCNKGKGTKIYIIQTKIKL